MAPFFMADSKLSQLYISNPVTPTSDDLVYVVDDPSGTPTDGGTTVGDILAVQHDHTASDITDFDTEVSSNTDVAANTSARHDAVTVSDSSEIDFTLTGQQISAALKSGSIDESKLDASVNASLDLADSATQPGDLATVATTGAYSDLSGTPTVPSTFDDLTDGTTNKAFTATEKTKLSGIAAGAEVNVQSDWNQSTTGADDYIKNKPTLGTAAAADSGDFAAASHTHTASQVTDFDTEVSNNTDVAANTTARHTHSNKSTLDTYTQTESDLADAVSKKHASTLIGTKTIDETDIADGKVIAYNSTSGKLEYETPTGGSGGGAWGSITGTLSDQTDLQSALDDKADDDAVVHDTGAETVAGVKTFSSFPVTPSSTPSTDYQVANKKYVDFAAGANLGSATALAIFGDHDLPRGYTLTKKGIVIQRGTTGTWNAGVVESPCVFFDPNAGHYKMIYVGYAGTPSSPSTASLGYAYSDDLENWTQYGSNPFFEKSNISGAPDQYGTTGGYCWYEDGVYHLFYIGLTESDYESGTKSLCHATSTDFATWTRHGAVITPDGTGWREKAIWHPTIVKRGLTYYLFFNATSHDEKEQIGYATSTDLSSWTVDDENSPLIAAGESGEWDDVITGDPCVYRVGETWYMTYYGYDGSHAGDGFATTSDGDFPLGWKKFSGNPVLSHGEASSYDALHAHKPAIWITPTKYYHWYTAVDDATPSKREIALAIHDTSDGSAVWGNLTGTLSDQTDLQSALDTQTHVAADITDFDTEVSNNTDVAANTTDRHSHSNKALLDTYTQTETNLADAVSKKHDSYLVGTKTVDEADIANGKTLQYNSTTGKLEYETPSGGGSGVEWANIRVYSYTPDTNSAYISTSGAGTTLSSNSGLQVDFSSSDSSHQFNMQSLYTSSSDSVFWDSSLYGYAYMRYYPNRNIAFGVGIGGSNTNSNTNSAYTGKGLGLRNSGGSAVVVRNGDGSAETTTTVTSSFPANDTSPGTLRMNHVPEVNDKFYLDDTLLATHTTNLPSGSGSGIIFIGARMYYGSSGQNDRFIIGPVGLIQVVP